jgi:hypothetical protein
MHTPPRETYYDDRILTNGVLLALAAQFVSTAVIVACHAIEFSFLVDRRAGGGLAVPPDLIAIVGAIKAEATPVRVIAAGLLLFALVRWMARINNNLRAAGVVDLEFSPRGCVLAFAIPFLNIWWPLKAMRELWAASHSPDHFRNFPSHAFINIWWCLFLFSAFMTRTAAKTLFFARGPDDLFFAHGLAVFAGLFVLASTVLTIRVVWGVHFAMRELVETPSDGFDPSLDDVDDDDRSRRNL